MIVALPSLSLFVFQIIFSYITNFHSILHLRAVAGGRWALLVRTKNNSFNNNQIHMSVKPESACTNHKSSRLSMASIILSFNSIIGSVKRAKSSGERFGWFFRSFSIWAERSTFSYLLRCQDVKGEVLLYHIQNFGSPRSKGIIGLPQLRDFLALQK
jgi:hypothetical protein